MRAGDIGSVSVSTVSPEETMRRFPVLLAGLLLVIGACGDDDDAGSTESSTTLLAETTTTTLTSATTTTQAPPVSGEGIVLATDGLGVVSFGAASDETIALMSAMLGQPIEDTGYETGTACRGTHRSVTWEVGAPDSGGVATTLTLHFTDDGRPGTEFTDYGYWRAFPVDAPLDARGLLETPEGITLGSSTAEVQAAYPGLEFVLQMLDFEVVGRTPSDLMLYPNYLEDVELDTDLTSLEGWLFGMRYSTEGCPDELS